MSFCINPKCDSSANEDADMSCKSCGTDLLLAGQYRVRELLSSGTGFGLIYKVSCQNSQKILKVLDLKVLKKKDSKDPKALEQFKREAEVLQRLNHPGIPRGEEYFEVSIPGSEDILHCLIMEKIQGLDLAAWLEKNNNKPISVNLALNWLKQIAEIIHALHQEGLFHRDIKPSNIMLSPNGELVLIDFGAAKKTGPTYIEQQRKGEGTIVYSPGYAPLEQEIGKATPQSDFFAIGRTFVHLLTGKTPNDIGDNYRNANTDDSWDWRPEAPHITPALADFIDYLMEMNSAKRPQNSQVLIDRLGELIRKINPQKTEHVSNHSNIISSRTLPLFSLRKDKNLGDFSTWHKAVVTAIVTTIDGAVVISASCDGLIKSWDIDSGKQLQEIAPGIGGINCLVISPDGNLILGGSNNGTLMTWIVEKDEKKYTIKQLNYTVLNGLGGVMSLAFNPDGKSALIGTQDKTIKIYDVDTNTFTGQDCINHQSSIAALDVSPDGSYFVSGGTDGMVRVWSEPNSFSHEVAVLAVKLDPRRRTVVSATASGEIKVWKIDVGDLLYVLNQDAEDGVNALLISHDGNFLISGSGNHTVGKISIWDLDSGQTLGHFNAHMHTVSALAMTPDGKRLISGSHDKSVKIWEVVSDSSDITETVESSHDG
jgi:serine/threonine protein kinase